MTTAIAELIASLSSGTSEARCQAAEKLAQMGDGASAAAVALVRACGDEEAVREWAVSALEELGPPPAATVPELSALVTDSRQEVAYWAVTLLGRMKAEAAAATAALSKALQSSPRRAVRERAAWALGEIGPPATAAVGALTTAAASREVRTARLAKQAIEQIRG